MPAKSSWKMIQNDGAVCWSVNFMWTHMVEENFNNIFIIWCFVFNAWSSLEVPLKPNESIKSSPVGNKNGSYVGCVRYSFSEHGNFQSASSHIIFRCKVKKYSIFFLWTALLFVGTESSSIVTDNKKNAVAHDRVFVICVYYMRLLSI